MERIGASEAADVGTENDMLWKGMQKDSREICAPALLAGPRLVDLKLRWR